MADDGVRAGPVHDAKGELDLTDVVHQDQLTPSRKVFLYGLPQRTSKSSKNQDYTEKENNKNDNDNVSQTTLHQASAVSVTNCDPSQEKGDKQIVEPMQVFDAQDEETFVLETFEELIRQHSQQGKHFIIARVKSRDRNDRSRVYYSIFSAHHLNKLLFRVDTQRNSLHRMRANNPYNNLPINGRVVYYIVTTESITESIPEGLTLQADRKSEDEKNIDADERNKQISENIVSSRHTQVEEEDPEVLASPSAPRHPIDIERVQGLHNLDTPKESKWVISTPPMANGLTGELTQHENGNFLFPKAPIHIGHFTAVYFATEIDFLLHKEIRQVFKDNALEAQDAILFSLNPDLSNAELGRPNGVLGTWVPLEGAVGGTTHSNSRAQSILRSWLQNPNLKWFLLLYIVLGFIVVRFLISNQYAYLGAIVAIVSVAIIAAALSVLWSERLRETWNTDTNLTSQSSGGVPSLRDRQRRRGLGIGGRRTWLERIRRVYRRGGPPNVDVPGSGGNEMVDLESNQNREPFTAQSQQGTQRGESGGNNGVNVIVVERYGPETGSVPRAMFPLDAAEAMALTNGSNVTETR